MKLKRHPDVTLDATFTDKGVSAFSGKHIVSGELAKFMDLVSRRAYPKGVVLPCGEPRPTLAIEKPTDNATSSTA